MPIYDLICTSCGYEKGETLFLSYDAFQKAEKERECPECHERLDAKISAFSINGCIKTTNGKILEKQLAIEIRIGKKPCGHMGVTGVNLLDVMKVKHDPEMN